MSSGNMSADGNVVLLGDLRVLRRHSAATPARSAKCEQEHSSPSQVQAQPESQQLHVAWCSHGSACSHDSSRSHALDDFLARKGLQDDLQAPCKVICFDSMNDE
jgi:hypothetical protein